MFKVIMFGTTGNYEQVYKTKKKAQKAMENIKLLGYDAIIKEI
jgi:hypothetical protein